MYAFLSTYVSTINYSIFTTERSAFVTTIHGALNAAERESDAITNLKTIFATICCTVISADFGTVNSTIWKTFETAYRPAKLSPFVTTKQLSIPTT